MIMGTVHDQTSIASRRGGNGLIVRVLLPFFLAVSLVMATVDTAAAQRVSSSAVRISFTVDRPEMTVGDVAILSLVVSHPDDLVVVLPRLEREWGPFEVQAQTSVQTISLSDGVKTIAKQFQVALFSPGAFETPDLPISIRNPDGSMEQVYPDPVELTVNSVLAGPDEELKDIRPPADLSTPLWKRPAVLVLAGLVVVGMSVAVGFYVYRRSRALVSVVVQETDSRKPWEVAHQELDRIARLDLPESGDFKEHYTLVAGTLRTYLGATYLKEVGQVGVTDMSTEEIGAAISLSSLDSRNSREVIELLQEADLVKFANYSPPSGRANEVVKQVLHFVDATGPALEQATPQYGPPATIGGAT